MGEQIAVTVETPPPDTYKTVFCNPAFEAENELEGNKDDIGTGDSGSKQQSPPASDGGRSLDPTPVGRPWCGCSALVLAACLLLLIAALGLALVLIFMQLKDQKTQQGVTVTPLDSWNDVFPSRPVNNTQSHITVATHPEATSSSKCGGILTDPDGTFSSPNHPGPYPPDSLCLWVIQVRPPALVQLRVSSLSVEGPSPCLFDWLELREVAEETSFITRFCGNVAPPTVNTNSSTVWVTFRSDSSIGGNGFAAQYQAILPQQKSCSQDEFLCDDGHCVLPVSVCDGKPDCRDRSDEGNCSHKHKECGGQKTGPEGSLSSPNHPKPYPPLQLCTWHISVAEGHVIRLSFRNFSLETKETCEFDYVEVHDSADTAGDRVLGRFCGTGLPPELTSTGPVMTVLFVADEGVADSGFFASYQAIAVSHRTCSTAQFACSTGECVNRELLCDGWSDCADSADEQGCANTTYPSFSSSCEPIQVEMCQGLSYNLTAFPNIWLSIADQREAAMVLQQHKVLMELACFQSLRRMVCGMVVPQCSPQGGVLQPCRSVCIAAQQQCGQALDLLSLGWPSNCHLFPDSQDLVECSLP
ncbi:membrane frizzled-related protein isoform X2 [Scleropages formosus]|uniref:membrane frizzled-related protein isoform X2 n=1 Tax=Scleropages formosus TaxID=113540 RepID=UPI0010FAA8DA|nr:membrane frizzled-related protein isoform X2 [Scleropages formosus]